ncbi:AMP-binding protein [Halospeciosus flavus]|uniref:AMP-binding protein n=1 Tax=Halospeciosus flavus TaxID=3032283 RepID=UPI0036106EA2
MDDLLSRRVRASPDATALVDSQSEREWTFADLDDAVDATACRLAELGVTADDRVGILMETRPAFVRLVFAVARLGAVVVPLNARLAPSELVAQREAADLICLVCEGDTEADALAMAEPVPVVSIDKPQSAAVGHLPSVDTDSTTVTPVVRDPTDPVALMFTSGTTGAPKAVRLTPRNFLASATASAFRLGVDPDDRWLCPLSMYHMGGLSVVVRSALYGTTAVLTRGFDADTALDALHEYDCTGVSLVPTMLKRLLAEGDLPDSLRFVLVGGAPTPRDLVETCAERDVPVYPSYGMTEATSQIATATPERRSRNPAPSAGRSSRPR